jgi:nitronate monooxygenase
VTALAVRTVAPVNRSIDIRPRALPVIAAPMYGVSGLALVVACCNAGIVGTLPASNALRADELADWLRTIRDEAGDAAWGVNLVMHSSNARRDVEVELAVRFEAPIVISSLGAPDRLIDAVHAYGGKVFADVATVAHARRAAERGADGLVLIGAGSGGHTGHLSPLGFVPAVREFYDGIVVAGGAIGCGAAVRAVEVLGATFAYVGSAFIATHESLASDAYRAAVVAASADDVVCTRALTGIAANMLRPSIEEAGINLSAREPPRTVDAYATINGRRVWHDIYSAGHGVGHSKEVRSVSQVVATLTREYERAFSREASHPSLALSASSTRS